MKKRIIASILMIIMTVTSTGYPVNAASAGSEEGKNMYGHVAKYDPVYNLTTTMENPTDGSNSGRYLYDFELFDSELTGWDRMKRSGNFDIMKYKMGMHLLNRFMIYDLEKAKNNGDWEFGHYLRSYRATRGWQYAVPNFWDGYFDAPWKNDRNVAANYMLPGLTWYREDFKNREATIQKVMNNVNTGNIGNMILKGDIEYFMSYRTCTYDKWWGKYDHIHLEDRARTFSYNTTCDGRSSVNCNGDGIPNLYHEGGDGFNQGTWKQAKYLDEIIMKATTNCNHNEGEIYKGVLVGRDIKGPSVRSIRVTTDPEGKNEIKNEIYADDIQKLKDRTIYFQVEWDEPVCFDSQFEYSGKIPKISLAVHIEKRNGDDGGIIEVPFYSYCPKKYESTPKMTFEYQIPDYYSASAGTAANQLGTYYRFKSVNISKDENADLYKHIQDLSGNRYCFYKGKESDCATHKTLFEFREGVDWEPFAIKDITVTHNHEDNVNNGAFLSSDELYTITLHFNKQLAPSVLQDDLKNLETHYLCRDGVHGNAWKNLPEITLNMVDKNGEHVKISPVQPSFTHSTVTNDVASQYYFEKDPKRNNSKYRPSFKYMWIINPWHFASYNPYLQAVSLGETKEYYKSETSIVKDGEYYKFGGRQRYIGMTTDTLSYNLVLDKDMTLDEEGGIQVISVTSPDSMQDFAGNKLLDYHWDNKENQLVPEESQLPEDIRDNEELKKKYGKSVDRQYKYDTKSPIISLELKEKEKTLAGNEKVIAIEATIDDLNMKGNAMAFQVNLEGKIDGTLQYQSASKNEFDAGKWQDASSEGMNQISFSSPIVIRKNDKDKAYGFLKLPVNSEVESITVSASAADIAGNQGSAESLLSSQNGWEGFDSMNPEIHMVKKGETAVVTFSDRSETVTYKYAWTDSDGGEPEWDLIKGSAQQKAANHNPTLKNEKQKETDTEQTGSKENSKEKLVGEQSTEKETSLIRKTVLFMHMSLHNLQQIQKLK